MLIRVTQTFKEIRYVTDDGRTMIVETTFRRGTEQTDRKLVFNRRTE